MRKISKVRLRPGDWISFVYDTPKEHSADRIGVLRRVYRARSTQLIMFQVEEQHGVRQFRYNKMRHIKVRHAATATS